MNNILSEKEYQRYIIDELVNKNGYIERKATDFDRLFAIDREMLFNFLWDTQSDTMDSLRKIYKDGLEDTIVNYLNAEMTKARGSLLLVLKHGVEISNYKLTLMYNKPATSFNNVDFPVPLIPMRPILSPSLMEKSVSSKSRRSVYDFVKCSAVNKFILC